MEETNIEIMSEDKQKRVAYALNMCTVSVSQIIDYNDVNILDQEYDAILNNLNLEEMPKDDVLLRVLKELLDVITHFKISEMERQFIEREYQQKMKNAIWSAVPNFGLILAGGSPLTLAVSLANQIGIGYMNYRHNKEEYGLGKDRQMWQLKRAAIDQFNFIRKGLFDCAWRLADTHGFPDSYRLTEKQIKQYNLILQDQDVRRKYERLEAVKENFEAYPPFWYFIGNAANLISNDITLNLSSQGRMSFRQKALEYFEKFEGIEQNSILREDVLSASCALEHIDLLLLEDSRDYEKINKLINKAVKMSGNAFDILQLCAITYLKIGNVEKAVDILRILVNEDYNRTVNAQMLSAIYVHSVEKYRSDYELLATRVSARYLFPMPEGHQDVALLESKFEIKIKEIAKKELNVTLDNYVKKYAQKWNSILSTFEKDKEYPDEFFYDDEIAKAKRKAEVERVFGNAKLKEDYQKALVNSNFEPSMRGILNDLVEGLFSIGLFSAHELQNEVEDEIRQAIVFNRNGIERIQKAISGRLFQMSDYTFSQTLTLDSFIGTSVYKLKEYGKQSIDEANISEVSSIESDLLTFCTKADIESPEVAIENEDKNNTTSHSRDRFNPELFGHRAVLDQKNADYIESMVRFVKERVDRIGIENGQAEILLRDDSKFNGYFKDSGFKEMPDIEAHAIMIIHDKTARSNKRIANDKDVDLIFTTDGLINVRKGKVDYLTPYEEVELENDKLLLYKSEYANKSVDKLALMDMISELGKKYARDLDDYIEVVPGIINMKFLMDWFKKNTASMDVKVDRVIAIPTKDNLEHLGYFIRTEMDTSKNLIQCYYESDTGDVLGMRIVRGEGIESKIVSLLLDNNGMIFIGRRNKNDNCNCIS